MNIKKQLVFKNISLRFVFNLKVDLNKVSTPNKYVTSIQGKIKSAMLMTIKDKAFDWLLVFVFCCFFLDFSLLEGVRYADVLSFLFLTLFFFCYRFRLLSISYIVFLLLMLATVLSGVLSGLIVTGVFDSSVFVMLYKWSFIFIALYFGYMLFARNIDRRVFFFVFFLFVIWSILYKVILLNIIPQLNPRVGFPSDKGILLTDGHLYSFVFGFYCLLFFFYNKSSLIIRLSLLLISVYVLTFTGSRSGLGLVVLFLSFYSLLWFLFSFKNKKNIILFLLVSCLALFFVAFSVYFLDMSFIHQSRSFDFNLSQDESANIRYQLFVESWSDAMLSNGFGLGPNGSGKLVLDGILSIILSHSGFIGLCVFIVSYFFVSYNILKFGIRWRAIKLFLLVSYIYFGNCISEYNLIARASMLTIAPLFYLYLCYKKEMREPVVTHR